MSWDIFVQDIPLTAKCVDDIPADFSPRPIASRATIMAAIKHVVPFADFSDPNWIQVTHPTANLEIDLRDDDPMMGFVFHVRGGDQSVGLIAAILDRVGLRAFDPGSDTGIFDPITAGASLAGWLAYRDQVVSTAKQDSRVYPFTVIANIMGAIQPLERGSVYEYPLRATLASADAGAVIGAGSQLNAGLAIAFVDIEMALANLEDALQLARSTLNRLGAPAGSVLLFIRDGQPRSLPIEAGAPEQYSTDVTAALRRRLITAGATDGAAAAPDAAVVNAAAKRILASFETLQNDQEFEAVDAASYPAEKREWYDRVGDQLALAGFRAMADVAIAARAGQPNPRVAGTFSRKFLSADGLTRADAFEVAPTAKEKGPVRVVVLGTEFQGGFFLTTSNATPKWNTPDAISSERLPPDAPVAAIVELHARRLADAPHEKAGRSIIALHTLEDILKSEARVRKEGVALKRRQGIPTVEELVRLGANLPFAQRVHAEMRRLRERNLRGL